MSLLKDFAKIEKVKYIKRTKELIIYVQIEDFFLENEIGFVEASVKNELKKQNLEVNIVSINIKYKLKINNKEDILKYIRILRYHINEIYPSTKKLNGNLKINYNENLNFFEIEVSRKAIFDILKEKNAQKTLETIVFNDLGKKIKIEIVNNDNLSIKDLEEKMENENEEIFKEYLEVKNKRNSSIKKSEVNNCEMEIKGDITKINDVTEGEEFIISGQVISKEVRDIKNNRQLLTLSIKDNTGAIFLKKWIGKDEEVPNIKEKDYIKVKGKVEFDNYKKALCLTFRKFSFATKFVKKDLSNEKIVDFHVHTNMSQMDGMKSLEEIMERLSTYGHKGIGIVDTFVVQSYPDAMSLGKKYNIKPIYGCEINILDDVKEYIQIQSNGDYKNAYVVFDIETTGFSNKNDKITEIGAVKIVNEEIVDRFSELINPQIKIPQKIQELTGITNELVSNKETIERILPKFLEFCKGSVLVAHNSDFDTGFIREKSRELNLKYDFDAIDTLVLGRILFPKLKNHKLDTLTKELNVNLQGHHRAVNDAEATAGMFLKFIDILRKKGINNFLEINDKVKSEDYSKMRPTRVCAIIKNQKGLKELYEIVSLSHTKYLQKSNPTFLKSLLKNYRENLYFGSGYYGSDIFNAVLSNNKESYIEELIKFYDYIELNPVRTMNNLVNSNVVRNYDELKLINKKIFNIATRLGKIVIASSNSRYLDEEERIYRDILVSSIKPPDRTGKNDYYFLTTDEMLKEFSYLGEENSRKIVIENTNKLFNEFSSEIIPVPDGKFPPEIEGSKEKLRNSCLEKAKRLYGEEINGEIVVPEIVLKRLNQELDSIINNGYAVMYIIAQKLVLNSINDGYSVGSRGSVGSSLAAYMSDITEVNGLAPHYICDNCHHSEFILDGSFEVGVDMPEKNCPKCGHKYRKDGFNIPFETFLGFYGDKEPDIDLNFAGEYQPTAHQYVMDWFGEDKVFRAGTIGTVASKTAYGFIKKYEEENFKEFSPAQIEDLQNNMVGVKRTTGQHPGGLVVIPKDKDILDFTPIQYPSNDKNSGVLTTHFLYKQTLEGKILKLDILGHDGPSIIKQLDGFIKDKSAMEAPLDDKKTMSIFNSLNALNCDLDEINCKVGTLGIPEFGTQFVRGMLVDTKPETFGELVRISGLSHGTDVWLNNCQDLIKNNVVTLKEAICTRDDIMNYLLLKNVEPKTSFDIMEKVRKGKGLTKEHEEIMREHKVPDWYIDSCKKIKYMFPKAHAVAYVMLSFRIAYYKVYYKEAFYATYFSTRILDFNLNVVLGGKEKILEKLREIDELGNKATTKEKELYKVLEVAFEMVKRNVTMLNVDLYKSHSRKFLLDENNCILPPLLAIEGLGDKVADKIFEEAKKGEFISIEDLKNRTGVSKTVVEELEKSGTLKNLEDTNQITFNF